MSVTSELSCGQDEEPPKKAALNLDVDLTFLEPFNYIQLEIYMNVCSLSLILGTFFKYNLENSYSFKSKQCV